MQYNRLN